MFIKPHATRNEYIRASNVWIRDFTKSGVDPVALDNLFGRDDHHAVVLNETQNRQYARIYDEKIIMRDVVIVSDGYLFQERHKELLALPPEVAILAVNHALRKWSLVRKRSINAYVVNNPYKECASFLPDPTNAYYPVCLASSRTYYNFLGKYHGNIYVYEPVVDRSFGKGQLAPYRIDDYRNPICAAIGLAYHFGVQRLMLVCCDDSFETKRDAAVKMKNNLWTYEQHLKSHKIIDANLHWLTHQKDIEVKVADWSSGPKYINANYISEAQEAINFFKEDVPLERTIHESKTDFS